MNFRIRRANTNDLDTLVQFNLNLASESEGKILNKDILSSGVLLMFSDPSNGFYLLAEVDGFIAGQLMITYELSDWRNGVFWWIQSVYVETGYRRKGVFTALYNEIEKLAKDSGTCCGIRLYVEENNETALKTYEALGLLKTHYFLLEKDFRNETP